jgi:peroxin-19
MSGLEPTVDDAFSEEDFAKQLQAGMADLLGELDKSVGCILLWYGTRR